MNKGLISVVSMLAGAGLGATMVGKMTEEKNKDIQKMSDKHFALFLLMNQWVKVKQEGKNLASYFGENGYKKIAIYGVSYVGETLIQELSGTEIEIAYGIDRNADAIYADIEVLSPEEELENVDAIVVTSVTFFAEIKELLSERVNCPIFSLEDILYEV